MLELFPFRFPWEPNIHFIGQFSDHLENICNEVNLESFNDSVNVFSDIMKSILIRMPCSWQLFVNLVSEMDNRKKQNVKLEINLKRKKSNHDKMYLKKSMVQIKTTDGESNTFLI